MALAPTKGHDEKVTELKSYLLASPKRGGPDAPEPEESLLPEAVASDGSEDDAAVDGAQDGEAECSQPSAADAGSEDGASDGAPRTQEDEDDERSQQNSQGSIEGGDSGSEEEGAGEGHGQASQETPSTLRAPTIMLDDARGSEESSSESAGNESPAPEHVKNEGPFHTDAFEAGDSQVPGSGWMGRAIANFNRREVGQDVLDARDVHYEKLLELIEESVSYQLGDDVTEGALWEVYLKWVFDAFMENGDAIFQEVVKGEFYRLWARKFKSEA